jgi:hypothetical protein
MTTLAVFWSAFPGLKWLEPRECAECNWLIVLMVVWLGVLVSLVAMAAIVEIRNRKQVEHDEIFREVA